MPDTDPGWLWELFDRFFPVIAGGAGIWLGIWLEGRQTRLALARSELRERTAELRSAYAIWVNSLVSVVNADIAFRDLQLRGENADEVIQRAAMATEALDRKNAAATLCFLLEGDNQRAQQVRDLSARVSRIMYAGAVEKAEAYKARAQAILDDIEAFVADTRLHHPLISAPGSGGHAAGTRRVDGLLK